MSKSILVLDENSIIHGLIDSALEVDGLTLHHEFNPGKYVERANTLMPDLILIGNSDTDPEYNICRSIKSESSLAGVPLVLLAGSKEGLTREQLQQMQVAGVVRKPFEASDLQQQVSKHLDMVELVGSAFEYQQSQKTGEEATNPLANLDVLDEEVMGMLKQEGPPAQPAAEAPGEDGVVDGQVLAETLEPERAFEIVEETPGFESSSEGKFDTLETFDEEFPDSAPGPAAAESDLEELGADDLLEEEAPEETILAPEGFDQSLDGEGTPPGHPAGAGDITADIEVELPESSVDMEGLDQELSAEGVEMLETELDTEAPEPPSPTDYEESVPDSVRSMMDLKPVFTMEQEESASLGEGGDLSFDPEAGDVEEIQSELDSLDEIGLDDGGIVDQEIEFLDDDLVPAPPQEEPSLEDAPAEAGVEDDLPPLDTEEPVVVEEAVLDSGDELPPLDTEGLDEPEMADTPLVEDLVVEEDSSSMFQEEAGEEDGDLLSEIQDEELPPDSLQEDAILAEAPPAAAAEDDEDFFREEYLGDEEIDEEQIISAEEEMEATEHPELSQEDEQELNQMMAEDKELDDLDVIEQEDVLASEEIEDEEEIELDQEEEDLIQASIEADQEAEAEGVEMPADTLEELPPEPAVDAADEPLFERNFNALEEEGTGGASEGTAAEESWELKETETGLALPPEDGDLAAGDIAAGDTDIAPSSESEEEFITLGEPIGDELKPPPLSADEGPGDEAVEDDEEEWSPDSPPGFIPKPGEEFPRETIEDPDGGSHRDTDEGEQSPMPRHKPEEVLEDPDSLSPILGEDTEPMLGDSPEMEGLEEQSLDDELSAGNLEDQDTAPTGEAIDEAFEPLDTTEPLEATEPFETTEPAALDDSLPEEPIAADSMDSEGEGMDDLAATLGGDRHEDALAGEEEAEGSAGDVEDDEFNDLFSSLQNEIAANPEGERIDDILRSEGLQARVAELEFKLPEDENSAARAQGLYALSGDGEESSAFPLALKGSGAPPPPAGDEPYSELHPLEKPDSSSALSLLDEDIRAKLGQVLDEIISISVRKAVQEEMPKIVERIARQD